MNFKPLTLNDADEVKPYLDAARSKTCDYTVGGLFMWRNFYKTEYAAENGVFYSKMHYPDGKLYYNVPLSLKRDDSVKTVTERIIEKDGSISYMTVPQEYLCDFDIPNAETVITEQRDYADYVYTSEQLITLAGHKLKGQRNQINQFMRSVRNWEFKDINDVGTESVLEFFRSLSHPDESAPELKRAEDKIVTEVLENLPDYKMFGGVLFANGKIEGFSLGEKVGDTLFTHVEKADRNFKGSYQMVVNQFSAKFGSDVKFINREDDAGDMGLRTAKLAYHPAEMPKKYLVTVRKK